MNYSEIVNAAINYSDRKDAETANNVDTFLRLTESRVNRYLKTQKMTVRSTLPTVKNQRYYGLPSDFNGLRDIQVNTYQNGGSGFNITMRYLSPEHMNDESYNTAPGDRIIYYTIIADQLQISPTQEDRELEIVYYKKLPELTSNYDTNWLSEENPDAYIFGVVTEISSFAKDAEAFAIYDGRFKEALQMIKNDDSDSRWSGSPLQVRV